MKTSQAEPKLFKNWVAGTSQVDSSKFSLGSKLASDLRLLIAIVGIFTLQSQMLES
jgi:hypothetical protein